MAMAIVDTDQFLDMPMSTRYLYYELNWRADDDGFVSSPKKIYKMVGCSEDDLKILNAKHYIIPFESGVCVITHWRISNTIKGDRYHPTQYLVEKAQLLLNDNKSYEICPPEMERNQNGTMLEPGWNQNGSELEPQTRLGKASLDKASLGERVNAVDKPPEAAPRSAVPYAEIQRLYSEICVSYPQIQKMSDTRRKAIRARWNEYCSIDKFAELFRKAEASDFMRGKNKRDWAATFDWMLKDSNMAKILEGNFDNRRSCGPGGAASYDIDEFITASMAVLHNE